MGSEHYCLRWNNHQSNLLGVFSQLLQDESLVDVTLACSEGAPIRAHKVVLSACSSYFQSLFLDHPEKHPIVILKDVRFAELQTLVEFMYKGEVNVQYCQLSALLKTAESLKVKGLAEMTNQNQTLREPEREPERLRPHSQPSKGSSSSCDSPVDATLSGPSGSALVAHSTNSSSSNNNNSSNLTLTTTASLISATTNANNSTTTLTTSAASVVGSKRSTEQQQQQQHHHHHHQQHDRCSPSPPKRLLHTPKSEQQHHHQRHVGSPLPLDLYQRRLEQEQEQASKENLIVNNNNSNNNNNNNTNEKQQQQQRSTTPQTSTSGTTAQKHSNSNEGASERKPHDNDGDDDDQSCFRSPERSSPRQGYHQQHHHSHRTGTSASGGIDKTEDMDDIDYADEEMDLDEDADNSSEVVGLNMKIRPSASSSLAAALVSPNLHTSREERRALLEEAESARSTPLTASGPLALDHLTRPLSRSSREGSGLDRPNSRGGLGGLPSTSLSSLTGAGGCLSPASSAAAALGLSSDVLAGPSGLGPVQSVPLSLKKEIDCSEDDNSSNSRHLQPRSASASGVLGGEFDYRTSHESETSESPHGLIGGINAGMIGGSGNTGSSAAGNAAAASSSSATSVVAAYALPHDHPRTPPPYICDYCGAGFPSQSKLTRHVLSHSLKTLEYRETTTHSLLHPHLWAHDLNMAPLAYQMNAAALAAKAGGDPQEQAAAVAAAVAMDMDFAAAIAAAGGCAFQTLTGCTARGLDLDVISGGSGMGGSSSASASASGRNRDSGGVHGSSAQSTSGNGGCPSSSLSLLSGAGSSTSAAAAALNAAAAAHASTSSASLLAASSAAAAAAAASSASSIASNDPNGVVLCKFCGKSFPDVTSLITHLPIHTGDRPFKCEFCGKAFKLRHHMKDHCRVHTGERPFRCQMCGKTFSRSTILKAHEKTHFPKYARKFLSPSPVDTKDELPQ